MSTPITPSLIPATPPETEEDSGGLVDGDSGGDSPHRTSPVGGEEGAEARRAALIGNFVDQFDIFLPVVALAGVIPRDHSVPDGLVFAATLLGRPLGAYVLGGLADTFGRARMSRLTLLSVSVCTAVMAMLPLASGGTALVALLALRFVAGFFLGGQYSSAIPRALDLTSPRRRGPLSGLIMAMSPSANAVIAAMTIVLTTQLGAHYASWGWRIPFAVATLASLALALTLRSQDQRHEQEQKPGQDRETPPKTMSATTDAATVAATSHPRRTAIALFTLMTGLWLFTMMGVSTLTSMLHSHLPASQVGVAMLVATLVSALAMWGAGVVSARTGPRRFFVGFGACAMPAAPLAYLAAVAAASSGSLARTAIAAALVQIVTVTAYGPVAAYLYSHVPPHRRSRGYGTAYSASIVLPGLYPLWLPAWASVVGTTASVPLVLALAGALVAVSAAAMGRCRDRCGPLAPA